MRVLEKKRQEREEVREKGRFEVHLGEMRRGEGTGEEGEGEGGEGGGLRGQQYGANRMQEETEIHCERGIVVCVCVYARARSCVRVRVPMCVCVCVWGWEFLRKDRDLARVHPSSRLKFRLS